jgi:thioredoxin reductase (NADPH)
MTVTEGKKHMQQQPPNGHEHPYDIAVIGAGPSGLFGAFYAGMRGMSTLIIDALPEMGGQLAVLYPEKYIYDVPGFSKILAKDLAQRLIDQALQFQPTVQLGEQVTNLSHVEHDEHLLEVTTINRSYYAKSVLIAAGVGAFAPNKLNIPGLDAFENKGVHYFVKDKSAFKDKQVLIVGGGDSAVDWALHFEEEGAKHVTLIHRRNQFRAHETSVQALHDSSVDVKLFHELHEIRGTDQVESVVLINNQTRETHEIPVDAILLALGFKADLGLIKEWGVSIERRSVQVGADQSTSMPGVYAAGDIAGTPVKLDLIAVGFAQAAVAVNSAKAYVDPSAKLHPGHSSSRTM